MSLDSIKNSHEITPEEQKAWERLSNELVFTSHVGIPIAPEYLTEISKEIQDNFVELQEQKRAVVMQKNADSFNKNISSYIGEIGELHSFEREKTFLTPELLSLSQTKIVREIKFLLNIESYHGQYFGWGFTPKLTETPVDKAELETNCLGRAILFGSYLKKAGINVEMGITPDHPFVIVNIDGRKYLITDSGEQKDITDEVEQKDGYGIYRPSKVSDKESDPKIMFIKNFDRAVLHEILENIEVLQQISNNVPLYLLPDSREEGEKIGSEHREALNQIDWKTLQAKLFPDMTQMFEENNEEWANEMNRVKEVRNTQFVDRILTSTYFYALDQLKLDEKNLETSLVPIVNTAREHSNEVIQFLRNGTTLDESLPESFRKFYAVLKENLDKIDPVPRGIVYDRIEKKLSETTMI